MATIQHWSQLTSPELQTWARAAAGRLVAVSVLGAIEQHGPHLSLGTDTEIGEGLWQEAATHLSSDAQVVVMPPMAIGASDEHADYAGTISLSPDTLEGVLVAYGEALKRVGIQRWVIINAHGGNVGVIDTAAVRLRKHFDLLIAKAYYPKFEALGDGPDSEELKQGLHGGQLETALMSALAPGQVRAERVEDFQPNTRPWAGQAPLAWLAQDLTPHGVAGAAHLGTAESGRALLRHYGQALAEVIDQLARHPLPKPKPRV